MNLWNKEMRFGINCLQNGTKLINYNIQKHKKHKKTKNTKKNKKTKKFF